MQDLQPRRVGGPSVAVVVAMVLAAVALGAAATAQLVVWAAGPQASEVLAAVRLGDASTDAAAPDGYRVWDVNDDRSPLRWDPCSPVELVVAPGGPEGFRDDLEVAVERVSAATGLDLVVTGATDERPTLDREPFQPGRYGQRWAPVLIAWASPGDGDLPLRDTDRGVAIPVAVGPAGDRTYVTGQVVFNQDRHDLRAGFGDRADSWGATILHELAHLVGLAHVDDADELMHTYPGEGPVAFGPGDQRGLEAVGAGGGCRNVPSARPVDVRPRAP